MAILNIFWLSCVSSVKKKSKKKKAKKKKEDCKLTDFFIMCCHCIIKTLLLPMLDLAKWLKNYRWKWIRTERGNKTLEIVHILWKCRVPVQMRQTWNVPYRYCMFLSLKQPQRGTLKHPKSTFQTLTCRNIFSILIFFMATVAFKYICLLGVNCVCSCYLCDLSSPKYSHC